MSTLNKNFKAAARCHHCGSDDLGFRDSTPSGFCRIECMECEATSILTDKGEPVGNTSPALRRHVNEIAEDADACVLS
jgi:hypothetical protein